MKRVADLPRFCYLGVVAPVARVLARSSWQARCRARAARTIEVESEPGKGSIFTLRLPIEEDA